MASEESTNSDAGLGDFSLAELASALPSEDFSPEYLEKIKGTDKEETKTESETGEVPVEETEAVVDEEEVKEEPPDETKEEEVKEEEKEEDSDLPKSVQKRIDKLTAEKYAVKDELEKAKVQITELQTRIQNAPVQTVPVAANIPLSDINDAQTLSLRESQAKAVKRFCMANPDGGIVKGTDGTETMLSAERIRELLIQSDELLTEQIPLRKSYLQQQANFSAEAKKEYPALFTNGSEEGQLAVQFLSMAPWVKQFPDWQIVLGDYVTGYKARLNKAKAAKAPPSKPVPVVKPLGSPRPAAGGTKVSSSQKNLKTVISEREGSISVNDAADLLSGFFS